MENFDIKIIGSHHLHEPQLRKATRPGVLMGKSSSIDGQANTLDCYHGHGFLSYDDMGRLLNQPSITSDYGHRGRGVSELLLR